MARADLGQVTAQEGGASSGLAVCLPFQQRGRRGAGRDWGEAGADGEASWDPAAAPPPRGKGALEPQGRSMDSGCGA